MTKPLSPEALSVWCRFCSVVEDHGPPRLGLAAALRAASDHDPDGSTTDDYDEGWRAAMAFVEAIAAELEGTDG